MYSNRNIRNVRAYMLGTIVTILSKEIGLLVEAGPRATDNHIPNLLLSALFFFFFFKKKKKSWVFGGNTSTTVLPRQGAVGGFGAFRKHFASPLLCTTQSDADYEHRWIFQEASHEMT
jgi:hypothetical protein